MEIVPIENTEIEARQGLALPSLITDAGPEAEESFLEFFFATIRNKNTRAAYARAVRDFLIGASRRSLN